MTNLTPRAPPPLYQAQDRKTFLLNPPDCLSSSRTRFFSTELFQTPEIGSHPHPSFKHPYLSFLFLALFPEWFNRLAWGNQATWAGEDKSRCHGRLAVPSPGLTRQRTSGFGTTQA